MPVCEMERPSHSGSFEFIAYIEEQAQALEQAGQFQNAHERYPTPKLEDPLLDACLLPLLAHAASALLLGWLLAQGPHPVLGFLPSPRATPP